jgi:hypothetical protein
VAETAEVVVGKMVKLSVDVFVHPFAFNVVNEYTPELVYVTPLAGQVYELQAVTEVVVAVFGSMVRHNT